MAEQVTLRDGTVVEVDELSGADEMIVSAYLGEAMEANAGGAMMYANCLIAQSIVSVGGEKRPPLRGFEDYRDFLAKFKGRDWSKIRAAYTKLNGSSDPNELKVK